MLSENTIDNLIQPMIDRQEAINNYVIGVIAERIKDIGTMKPTDVYKIQRLYRNGTDLQKINKELARLTGLQEKDIKKLIKSVAKDVYIDAKPMYDYRHKSYVPFEENTELQRVVRAVEEQTVATYRNLSNAQAFMLRDMLHPQALIQTPIAQAYQTVVDEAIQSVVLGTEDYQSSMRRTLKQLVDSGLRRVVYTSEKGIAHTQRIDTALRRNLLDGVRNIQQSMHDEVGRQFGADGVELTAHRYSALDHEEAQGHQFSREEFEKMQSGEDFTDVNGREYKGFDRPIGMWNCRHFAISIIIGFSDPTYTQEQLDTMIANNHKGYTLQNGKHLTMYECTQEQRKLETKIRYAKDGQIAARKAGDEELAKEYQAKINKYTNIYKSFSNACGLKQMNQKASVNGYHKIKV